MEAVFREILRLSLAGEPYVLTTVVTTKGSTPQKPGSKLLIRKDGTGVGTLGGGCVEADVWAEARLALESDDGAVVREFQLADDIAADSGMVCGGTMEILLDPVLQSNPSHPSTQEILDTYSGGQSVALATILNSDDPKSVGNTMVVREDSSTWGSLGNETLNSLASGNARSLLVHGGTKVFKEEQTEVFVEAFVSPPHMIVCGGGHISKALYPIAHLLGFRFSVIDERNEFCNRERFPEAHALQVTNDYQEAMNQMGVTPNTFIVIATRGHKPDDEALLAGIQTPARYVGLVGSLRKTLLIYEELFRRGVSEEKIKGVRAPVGLNIHARTPEEIALSIMAEIEMVRLGGDGQPRQIEEHRVENARKRAFQSKLTKRK